MILTRDVPTPVGILAAGSPVEILTETDTGVTIRVPHVGAISWTVTVPRDGLTRRTTLRRDCQVCGRVTFTRTCAVCRAYRQIALGRTA